MTRAAVQQQIALFEQAERERIGRREPSPALVPANLTSGPCAECAGATASYPDFGAACRKCKTGRELDHDRVCRSCVRLLDSLAARDIDR